jgi:WS/DGAT/MGAT family acyltransferase
MANPDRLTALDSTFLHLEDHSTAHMHVASVMVFEGQGPTLEELVEHINSRLHLVPRYRQRLAHVPFGQGRPIWTDDPHFNPYYHIRHTALPKPADDEALKELAGRLFSQRLDRSKPLWEIWLVQRMAGEHFALIAKTHHALVDGISGVDITTVLFDTQREPAVPPAPATPWAAKPLPGKAKLLGEALLERTTVPNEMVRGGRALLRAPRRALSQVKEGLTSLGATTLAGINAPAPPTPFNVTIGPHRRYTFLDVELSTLKGVKDSLGGTLNDAVLTSVALALGRYLRDRQFDTDGLVLKAMVPVSVRSSDQRGALGNQVAAMWAPLPVGVQDPAECLRMVADAMDDLKKSGQAVGAQVLTDLAGFALEHLYPVVPLAQRQALGIAVMSYDGSLGFGLLGDYDALPELEGIARDLEWAIKALADAAGVTAKKRARSGTPRKKAVSANSRAASGARRAARKPAGAG